MYHYLTQEEHDLIHTLRGQGVPAKQIAEQLGICEATVFNVSSGRTKQRSPSMMPKPRRADPVFLSCEDLSKLPDHIMFQHSGRCF